MGHRWVYNGNGPNMFDNSLGFPLFFNNPLPNLVQHLWSLLTSIDWIFFARYFWEAFSKSMLLG